MTIGHSRFFSRSIMTHPSLKELLFEKFGFPAFRHGQERAIDGITSGRDVAVYLATGSGKSICYQLPALALWERSCHANPHMGMITLVISPLISLMEDQVYKFNHTIGQGQDLAAYLGSAQTDSRVEERALEGQYPLVYLSPEKILSDAFMPRLCQKLGHRIGLIAIDEAHCCTEWGHDFRKEYSRLRVLRQALGPGIPVMALTATAGPEQRESIHETLALNDPMVVTGSVDRTNLAFQVHYRASAASLDGSTATLVVSAIARNPNQATIVYVRTRADAVRILAIIQAREFPSDIKDEPILVEMYHAGMSLSERQRVHVGFLQGKITVVVATIAFGMGIDKPDIRRVIHCGPPQTIEAYYQQVGRAGRDGLPASCIMFATMSDFANYRDPFYVGKLSAKAKSFVLGSLDKLQHYASNSSTCRRSILAAAFGESLPSVCGICDTCTHGPADIRDFYEPAWHVLRTFHEVPRVQNKGMTALVNEVVQHTRKTSKDITSYSKDFYKELVLLLQQHGYLSCSNVAFKIDGFQHEKHYVAFEVTPKGRQVIQEALLAHTSGHVKPKIELPVPPSVRNLERAREKAVVEREAKARALFALAGVDLECIPASELAAGGKGPISSAHLHWYRTLTRLRENERHEKAQALEKLLEDILAWRRWTATTYRLAPGSVLTDHMAKQLAYSQPTDLESLHALGIRIVTAESLCAILKAWVDKHSNFADSETVDTKEDQSALLMVDVNTSRDWQAPRPWTHCPPKPAKKPPYWQHSYQRFQAANGSATLAAIAVDQPSGKPVQPETILRHLMLALEAGLPVDLNRLLCDPNFPRITMHTWHQFQNAFGEMSVDIHNSPAKEIVRKDVLMSVLGPSVSLPFDEKTEDERKLEATTYAKLGVFLTFVRMNVPLLKEASISMDDQDQTRSAAANAPKRRKIVVTDVQDWHV